MPGDDVDDDHEDDDEDDPLPSQHSAEDMKLVKDIVDEADRKQKVALAEAKRQLGNNKFKEGEYDDAISFYTDAIDALKSIELDPAYEKGYFRAAKCYLAFGEFDRAKVTLQRISRTSQQKMRADVVKEVKIIEEVERRLEEAKELVAASEFQRAKGACATVLELAPEALPVRVLLAEIMIGTRNYDNAKVLLTDLMKDNPRNSEVIRLRGLAQYYTGQLESASKHFQQILRTDPDNVKAIRAFKRLRALENKKDAGNKAFQTGRNTEAVSHYTDALGLDPQNASFNATLFSNRAAALMKLGRWEQALTDCDACIKLKPDFLKAYTRRAQCNSALSRWKECVEDYEHLCKEQPENEEYASELRSAKRQLKKSSRKNYYAILGVNQNFTPAELKKAYRDRAKEHHPDRHMTGTEEERKKAEAMFKDVGESYEALSDPKKRRAYDMGQDIDEELEMEEQARSGGRRGGMGGGMDDVIRMMFGMGGGGRPGMRVNFGGGGW